MAWYAFCMTTSSEQYRLQAELETIQQAILDIIEGGQSVTIGDMSYTEASIDSLRVRETEIRRRLARLDGSRPAILGVSFANFPR